MKHLKPSCLLIGLSLIFNQITFSQELAVNKPKETIPGLSAEAPTEKMKESGAPLIANPDAKLVASRLKVCPNATAQEWRMMNNGYYVSFLNSGRKAKAMLSQKGKMNYAITDCTLAQLPSSMQKKIASQYAAYTFVNAVEINAYDAIAHQAVLQNSSGYITLKATREGIEEVDTQKKVQN